MYPTLNDLTAALNDGRSTSVELTEAALTQIRADDAVAANAPAAGYGGNGDTATQSGRRHVASVAERSVYFGH